MQFIVRFYTRRGKIIDEDLSAPGLDMVDDIRENLGKRLTLDKLSISCPYYGTDVKLTLKEESIRKIPFFKGNTNMTIEIPTGFFSRYLMYKPFFDWNRGTYFEWISKLYFKFTGKLPKRVNVEVKTILDSKQIIKDWIADGHPTEWGFTND